MLFPSAQVLPFSYTYKSEIHYAGIKCTLKLGRSGQCLWRSGGWSEHIGTHDSMLGSFVSRQEGTRVGKKESRIAVRCVYWNVCVCFGLMSVFYLFLCSVYVDHNSCFATLRTHRFELDTRNKKGLHICACMSRITCSIECSPLSPLYYLLITLCAL